MSSEDIKTGMSIRKAIVSLAVTLVLISSLLTGIVMCTGMKKSLLLSVDKLMHKIQSNILLKSQYHIDSAAYTLSLINDLYADKSHMSDALKGDSKSVERLLEKNAAFKAITVAWLDGSVAQTYRSSTNVIKTESFNRGSVVQQSWYLNAVKSNDLTWTGAYWDTDLKESVIRCSMPIRSSAGGSVGAMSIAISLLDISSFLGSEAFSESTAFILDKNDQVVAFPLSENPQNEFLFSVSSSDKLYNNTQLIEAKNFSDPEVSDVMQRVISKRDGKGTAKEPQRFMIETARSNYLVSNFNLASDSRWDWNISILVPEDAFLSQINYYLKLSIGAVVIVVIFSIIVSMLLARRISTPLEKIADDMLQIKDLRLESKSQLKSRLKEVIHMTHTLDVMKGSLRSFRKYVPTELVRQLMQLNEEAAVGGEDRDLTVFFSDIADFTTLAEKYKPDEINQLLSGLFQISNDTIRKNQGTVDKYIGDAVMAFWGAPVAIDDAAICACKSALQIQNELTNSKLSDIKLRIGIHTGSVVVGNVGSDDRLNYTVIGDNVNIASRLEGLGKYFGTSISISGSTYEDAKDAIEARELDHVVLKGRTQHIAVYEVLAEKGKLSEEKKQLCSSYEQALAAYRNKDWDGALEMLNDCLELVPGDRPSTLLKERVEDLKKSPPDADWVPVTVMTEK